MSFRSRNVDRRAILSQATQATIRVGDRDASDCSIACFRTQVQDHLHTVLRAKMHGREVLRCTEARHVPLDAFGDAWIGTENNLPEGENLGLERVIKRREKCLDILRRGRTALGWFLLEAFGAMAHSLWAIKRANAMYYPPRSATEPSI